ncbi:alpha/beta fold hydrolase [Streptomyces sp. NPDC015346]|uniref:alpha/beta fold hydrolase n=1 Tax=Streptomyces sp. NPDC015346 TaxID=3364954 RepID=UPI0036FE1F8E
MRRRAFDVQLAAPEEFGPVDPGVGAAELAAIALPTLVVSGAHDVADFREIATRLAALLPDARYLDLNRAGHLPALERPEGTSRLLLEFLSMAGDRSAAA